MRLPSGAMSGRAFQDVSSRRTSTCFAGFEVVAPQVAGAVRHAAVADVDEPLAIRQPRRAQLMVVAAVVVAFDGRLAFGYELPCLQFAVVQLADEHVKAPGVAGRDEREPFPVRRPARLEIHRAAVGQRSDLAALEIEQHEFDGVVVVAHEHDPFAVRRPVGLVVVARTRSELHGDAGVERLPPQAALHRVHEFLAVRRPGERARPARQLRQVHLAEIVVVRNVDLLQHGRALGRRFDAEQQQRNGKQRRAQGQWSGHERDPVQRAWRQHSTLIRPPIQAAAAAMCIASASATPVFCVCRTIGYDG